MMLMSEAIFTQNNILFSIVIFIANIIQGLTGFGGSLLAMPPAILLQGMTTAKIAINTYGLVSSLLLFILNYKSIDKKEALKIIGFMLAGMVIGIYLSDVLQSEFLLRFYAIFIIVIVLKEVFYQNRLELNEKMLLLILISAGIFHGLFISGGPLLIIYVTKKLKDPNRMRGTLGLIWLVLYIYMLINQVLAGQFSSENLTVTIIGLPFVFAGVALGNKLIRFVNKEKFLRIVHGLLLLAALSLLI